MKTIVAPSILSADFYNLEKDIKMLNSSSAEWIHFDVMDGHFVPNLTFGPMILEVFKKNSDKFLDVHIMVENPKFFADLFIDAGADQIVFHYEALANEIEVGVLIDYIQSKNVKCGVSIKPNTDIKVLDKFLDKLDLVLVMSVEPGFGGQSFMENMLDKVSYLTDYKKQNKSNYLIQIDGGINDQTAIKAVAAGAEVLVAGSYLFKASDFNKAVESLIINE